MRILVLSWWSLLAFKSSPMTLGHDLGVSLLPSPHGPLGFGFTWASCLSAFSQCAQTVAVFHTRRTVVGVTPIFVLSSLLDWSFEENHPRSHWQISCGAYLCWQVSPCIVGWSSYKPWINHPSLSVALPSTKQGKEVSELFPATAFPCDWARFFFSWVDKLIIEYYYQLFSGVHLVY